MTPFSASDFESYRPLGQTGFHCSRVGMGTGSCRLSDWAQSPPSPSAEVWELACRQQTNIFDLGCAACEPQAVLARANALANAWPNSDGPIGNTSPLTILRYDLRCLSSKAVDLRYQLRAQSIAEIRECVTQRLEVVWSQLGQVNQICDNMALIWDGIDLDPSAARPIQRQRHELLQHLLDFKGPCRWQGLGGFAWPDLTEMTGRFHLDLILIHAAFGLLGPTLDDSLVPACRRKGIGILTTLPCYGGLITAPDELSAHHPASEHEVQAAQAARLMAEEFEVDLTALAVQAVCEDSGPDCLLLELPTASAAQYLSAKARPPINARKNAIITRHYRTIERTRWWNHHKSP